MDISTHKRKLAKANRTYIKLNFLDDYLNIDFEELLFVIGFIYEEKKIFSNSEITQIELDGVKKSVKNETLKIKSFINAYAIIKKQTKLEMNVGWMSSRKLKVSNKEIWSIRKNFVCKNKGLLCIPYKIEYIFQTINNLIWKANIENTKKNIIQKYFSELGTFTYGKNYYNTHILSFNHIRIDTTCMNDAAQHCVEEVEACFTRNSSIFNSSQTLKI